MKLLPHEVEVKLQEQFIKVWSNEKDWMQETVQARLYLPDVDWEYYLITQDPEEEEYLWAIVKGFEVEAGSVWLPELVENDFILDTDFIPTKAEDIWNMLRKGKA